MADYLLYTAALFFSTHVLGFWIEQGAGRRVRGRHLFVLLAILIFMLFSTTYFVEEAWEMNGNLTPDQDSQKMDWRIRNLLISYIMYYCIVIQNLFDCFTLWFITGFITMYIIADIIESYELGRTS